MVPDLAAVFGVILWIFLKYKNTAASSVGIPEIDPTPFFYILYECHFAVMNVVHGARQSDLSLAEHVP